MLFLKKDTEKKVLKEGLTVHEYCGKMKNLPIDGAVCFINTTFGPKANKFNELFFVLEGKLEISFKNGKTYVLEKEDMCIIPQNEFHTIVGRDAKAFVVCNPQFDPNKMEFSTQKTYTFKNVHSDVHF